MAKGKRGRTVLFALSVLSILLIFLGVLVAAKANHDAIITLTPLQFYETTTRQFNISIDNWGSSDRISEVTAENTGFQILNMSQHPDWDESLANSTMTWQNGIISTNVRNAVFYYYGKSQKVDNNQTYATTITTKDEEDYSQSHELQLTILNDASGPILSNLNPADGSYIREGADLNLIAYAGDPETGTDKVSFNYKKCDDADANLTTIDLEKQNNSSQDNASLYTGTADIEDYPEGTYVCFTFSAESGGGALANYTGRFGFDRTPPAVDLISPDNNEAIDETGFFRFNATDNLASALECRLLADGNQEASASAASGETAAISSSNISEGTHLWKVSCSDPAGNTAESQQRTYTLDRSAPVISFNDLPDYIARGNSINLSAAVTDISAVNVTARILAPNGTIMNLDIEKDGNEYKMDHLTALDTEQGYYNITYKAMDIFGHLSQKTARVLVTYSYKISLGLNPDEVGIGGAVDITGRVLKDDGSIVPENKIILVLPSEDVEADINNDTGNFGYSFSAPNSAGQYLIMAKITAENNMTYTGSAVLKVKENDDAGSSSGSGSSGGSHGSSNNRNNYANDAGFVIEDLSKAKNTKDNAKLSIEDIPENDEDSISSDADEGASDGVSGVGQAAGFFNLHGLDTGKLIWTAMVFLAIIGVYGKRKHCRRRRCCR